MQKTKKIIHSKLKSSFFFLCNERGKLMQDFSWNCVDFLEVLSNLHLIGPLLLQTLQTHFSFHFIFDLFALGQST